MKQIDSLGKGLIMKAQMGWQKRAFATLAAITCALALVSCSGTTTPGGDNTGSEKIRIGAIYMDSQGFYAGVKAGVNKGADKAGVDIELIETNAQGDVSKETTFIDSLIAAQVDAIIMSAVSYDGSVAAVKAAHDAGIKVICYNACVNEDAIEKYVYAHVVGDPFKFGETMGTYVGEFYEGKGITDPKFGIVNCEQYEACKYRQQGFERALMAILPDAKIVSNQEGTETDRGIKVAEEMLTAHPEINGMWGQSGGAAEGALQGVINRGLQGKVWTFGSDMTTVLANGLVDGKVLQASVDVSGSSMGELTFSVAMDAINGVARTEKIVDAPIVLWKVTDGARWLEEHPNGIP